MSAQETFPELELETPRLLLRPYRAEDAPEVALACRDELTQRWLPLPNPYTDADAIAWCTKMAPGFRPSRWGYRGCGDSARGRPPDRLLWPQAHRLSRTQQ